MDSRRESEARARMRLQARPPSSRYGDARVALPATQVRGMREGSAARNNSHAHARTLARSHARRAHAQTHRSHTNICVCACARTHTAVTRGAPRRHAPTVSGLTSTKVCCCATWSPLSTAEVM